MKTSMSIGSGNMHVRKCKAGWKTVHAEPTVPSQRTTTSTFQPADFVASSRAECGPVYFWVMLVRTVGIA